MSLSGGILAKILAAVMTVPAGQPVVGCVCPDGRVKFFCPGPTASRCCCAPASSPPTPKPRCCGTAERAGSRCGHRTPAAPPGDGPAVKGRCCERTVVTEAAAYTAQDDAGEVRFAAAAPVDRVFLPVPSGTGDRPDRAGPKFLLPPPDLIITFCHLTC